MKNNPFATLAYGAMTLLVAVYIAFVALLMHHDAMPIPVFAGIAFAARSSSPPDAARWSTPST